MTKKTFINTLLLGAACLLSAHAAAQSYPSKPIKLIVPYAAGGPVDGVARGYADRLSKEWGQPVLVDNRAGGNEVIAADLVAKSPADGYTMLWGADPTFSTNQFLFRKLPYNPLTDLIPVTRVTFVNMALIVDGRLPVNTMKDQSDGDKAKPQPSQPPQPGPARIGVGMAIADAEVACQQVGIAASRDGERKRGIAGLAQRGQLDEVGAVRLRRCRAFVRTDLEVNPCACHRLIAGITVKIDHHLAPGNDADHLEQVRVRRKARR
ncbi:hypothetical protein OSTOST_01377 [Ostertagia ostertagi]